MDDPVLVTSPSIPTPQDLAPQESTKEKSKLFLPLNLCIHLIKVNLQTELHCRHWYRDKRSNMAKRICLWNKRRISLPMKLQLTLLMQLAKNNMKIDMFLRYKHFLNLNRAHLTLACKRSRGTIAVADYEGEKIVPKNAWPYITSWTSRRVSAKEANMLPQLFAERKANRIDFNPPINISGTVEFY
ncbi:hypothetical protein KIW84_010168 [Lathyrus oleraceus]|uniref:Uncharacterized protein n=1 Tax=Pisum sativum TaxID=3888 RepID=A0A9D4YJ52_PEA|nr:hypothetical protein KIW84_010168 [Pisum sativum]